MSDAQAWYRRKKEAGFTWKQLADELGIPKNTVRMACRRTDEYKADNADDVDESDTPGFDEDSGIAYSADDRVRSLDDLIAACKIDTEYWECISFTPGTYESTVKVDDYPRTITMYRIRAKFKPRNIHPFEIAFDGLVERLAKQSTKRKKTKYTPKGDHLLAFQMYDPHFGKLAATEDWSLSVASDTIRAIGKALVSQARALPYKVDRILFPVGNDIFQADDLAGRTTLGTWVETCASQADMIDTVLMDYIYLIELFALLAPVDIAIVQSNHDRQSVHWLGRALWAFFNKDKRVTIDGDFYPRKYYRYGVNLLGMEHGDKVKPGKLALLMATEAKEDWAQTSYWEWWRGHIHSERAMLTAITEEVGVKVRTIPALCPPDMWHLLRGFDGARRAAYGMYYHRENGPGVEFPVYVNEVIS